MHESALMTGLVRRVKAVAAAEGAARVVRVSVRIGPLSPLTPDHLAHHFAHAAQGTVAGGAALDVTVSTNPADPAAQGLVLEGIEVET